MNTSNKTPWRRLAAALLLSAGLNAAQAADLSWSGFGTVAASQSNRDWRYLRFIDRSGTLNDGSVLGLQADLRLSPQWSATVQLKAAPAVDDDHRWSVQPSWAFLAWRPADEWLVRAGRLRLPLYLYSESLDLGVAQDVARHPVEMYSIVPNNDFDGLFVTRTWAVGPGGASELSLEGYGGSANATARLWTRDGAPPTVQPGPYFGEAKISSRGLILTLRAPSSLWRLGVHDAYTRRPGGELVPKRFPRVELAPGLGYWRVNESLPGPPIETTDRIHNVILTAGAEVQLGNGWRVAGEYARNRQRSTELGSNTTGGYVAAFKTWGDFTPYLSLSRLRTGADQMRWYRQLTEDPLPPVVPGASAINGAQRLTAEITLYAAEQDTTAVGTSYALHPGGKLKLEWARTRIGAVSRLVDAPPGQPTPARTSVDVWTLSYSVAF